MTIIELISKYPNDSDLGYQVRELKHLFQDDVKNIIDNISNDQELGEYTRSKIRKFYN